MAANNAGQTRVAIITDLGLPKTVGHLALAEAAHKSSILAQFATRANKNVKSAAWFFNSLCGAAGNTMGIVRTLGKSLDCITTQPLAWAWAPLMPCALCLQENDPCGNSRLKACST